MFNINFNITPHLHIAVCTHGRFGKDCHLPCKRGYYGHLCLKPCECEAHICNEHAGCTTRQNETCKLLSTQLLKNIDLKSSVSKFFIF